MSSIMTPSNQSKPGKTCHVILRPSSPETQLAAVDWSRALQQARTQGWALPSQGTENLLIGELVDDTRARGFAKAVAGSPERDDTDEIAAFCRQGSFLIDSP